MCSTADSYLGVACTPTEQTCYECYCKLAAVGFQAASYCYKYWPKYVIQAGAGTVASSAPILLLEPPPALHSLHNYCWQSRAYPS